MSDKIEFELDDTDPGLALLEAEEAEGATTEPTPATAQAEAEPAATAEPVDGIAELKAKLEAEQKERQAAQDRARMAEERAAKSEREATDGRNETIDSRISQLSGAIQQLNSNAEVLKREYRDAYQTGDADKLADLQFKMSEIAAQRMRIEDGKAQLEHIKKTAPKPAPAAAPAPANKWEQDNPRSAAWLKQNASVAADDEGKAELALVHARALKAGHAVDSEGYIGFFDKHFAKAEPEAAPVARRATPPAAPVSRQSASAPTVKTVKLTAFDREMAELSGVSLEDYARSKIATQKA